MEDASTNIVPWGILIGGEELHNNLHAYASSARLSNKWYEFDIGWLYIRILETLGQAKVKKVAPTPKLGATRVAIDLHALEAVITHRYDVLAKYLKSAKLIAAEEFTRLKLDARESRMLKGLLRQDAETLAATEQQVVDAVLAKSERLATVVTLRRDLEELWERSTATHEQLVKQLQDWVARAEASGIRQLEEFSLRLRSYAV